MGLDLGGSGSGEFNEYEAEITGGLSYRVADPAAISR
jgi:hypothetical protein